MSNKVYRHRRTTCTSLKGFIKYVLLKHLDTISERTKNFKPISDRLLLYLPCLTEIIIGVKEEDYRHREKRKGVNET